MLNTFTVSFFGHRDFHGHRKYEATLEQILKELIHRKDYVEFLVGRNGEFDKFVSTSIRQAKRKYDYHNSSLVWVLPYSTADLRDNIDAYKDYYDEIEICENSANAHYKSAIQLRNREMVDRSDLIICCIERKSGGAYQTVQYAIKKGKKVIYLADKK